MPPESGLTHSHGLSRNLGAGIIKNFTDDLRPSTGEWVLDMNGNGHFDGCAIDACLGPFGHAGDLPVVGKW